MHSTKQKIIDTTLTLFIEKGYEQTTIADVIKVSNLSKGGVYHHFSSKENIADEILTTYFKNVVSYYEQKINNENALDKFNIFCEACHTIFNEDQKQALVSILINPANSKLRSKVHSLSQKYFIPLLVHIFEEGNKKRELSIKNPEATAYFICCTQNSLLDLPKEVIKNKEKIKPYQEILENIISHMIHPK